MQLAGYSISDVIYSIEDTVVARAIADSGAQAILKYQNSTHPSVELNARLLYENCVLQAIDSPWVIRSFGVREAETKHILSALERVNLLQSEMVLLKPDQLPIQGRLLESIPVRLKALAFLACPANEQDTAMKLYCQAIIEQWPDQVVVYQES